MLCLAGCVSVFGGSGVDSPLFSANFRESASFPHLDPFDNVLLVTVSDAVDNLSPDPTLELRIDGTLVHSQTVSQGGTLEVTFPPAAWTPSSGEHELEIKLGTITRTLPFTWNG